MRVEVKNKEYIIKIKTLETFEKPERKKDIKKRFVKQKSKIYPWQNLKFIGENSTDSNSSMMDSQVKMALKLLELKNPHKSPPKMEQ